MSVRLAPSLGTDGAGLVFITAGSTAGSPPPLPLYHTTLLSQSLSLSLAGHYCSCMFCSFEDGRVAAKAIAPPSLPPRLYPALLSCKHIIFPVRLPCTFISALMIQDAFRSWRPNDRPLCRAPPRLTARKEVDASLVPRTCRTGLATLPMKSRLKFSRFTI